MRSTIGVQARQVLTDEQTSDHTTFSSQQTAFKRDLNPTTNHFIVPPPNGTPNDFSNDTTWTVGAQTIEVSWASEWSSVDLAVCQPTNGATYGCYTVLRGTLSSGYHWSVANVTDHMNGFGSAPIPNVYYFQLTETNTLIPTIQSHYFNIITDPNESNSTSTDGGNGVATPGASATSSSHSTESTLSNSSTIASSGTTTTSAAAASPSSSGISISAMVGLGAAAGIIVVGLLASVAFCLVVRRRRRKRTARLAKISIEDSVSTLTSPVPLQEMDAESHVHETGKALPHEISSKEIPMELPAEIPGLAISTYEEHEKWDDNSLDDQSVYSRRESYR